MIDENNWNYAGYKNGKFQAVINLVGQPAANDIEIRYSLTLIDDQNREYFQNDFDSLEVAMAELNSRYSHWEFFQKEEKDEGGCSSCQAH